MGPGIRPQRIWTKVPTVCIEPYPPYAEWLRKRGYTVLELDAMAYACTESCAGACVVLLDVIEHLEKPDGVNLIQALQADADSIVLFTPLGFLPQEGDAWGMGGDDWQRHRSGWVPEELPGWTIWQSRYVHWEQGAGAFVAVWRRPWRIIGN